MRVEDFCQDAQGYVWIATSDGGVSRFDGEHFRNLGMKDGLPHHVVMGVRQGTDGAMWFATLGGGLARRVEGDGWRVFTRADGLPSDEVLAVRAEEGGAVRAFTRGGMCRVEEDAVVEVVSVLGKRHCGPVRGAARDAKGTTGWRRGTTGW